MEVRGQPARVVLPPCRFFGFNSGPQVLLAAGIFTD